MSMPEHQRGERDETEANRLLYAVVVGLILGAIGIWTAVTHHPAPDLVVRYVAVGVVYLGVGYWLFTRGYGRLGFLVALTGALWFAPELNDSDQGMLVGIGILFEHVYLATFAHAVLVYPNGQIRPRAGVWLVAAAYVVTLVGGLARALTYQPNYWQSCDCPHNGFAVAHSQSLYDAINDPYRLLLLILGFALIPVIAMKLRPAEREGADVRPVWAALVGATLILASGFAREALDVSLGGLKLWLWVEGIGLLLAVLSLLLLLSRKQGDTAGSSP